MLRIPFWGHNYFPDELTLEDLPEVTMQWSWYRTKLLRNETPVETDDYLTDELSNAGVEFVERSRESRLFDPMHVRPIREDSSALHNGELRNLLKMEGFSNMEAAERLHCGLRTIERRLGLIRSIWMERGG